MAKCIYETDGTIINGQLDEKTALKGLSQSYNSEQAKSIFEKCKDIPNNDLCQFAQNYAYCTMRMKEIL